MSISDDSKGYLLSVDLLLALIPLTILIGVAAANMDNIFYLTQDTIFQSSMERVGAGAVDTLVETSGEPYNWETTGNATVVGLAKYDNAKKIPIQNQLSAHKLNALTSSHIQGLLGDEYGFFLNISTTNNTNITTIGTYNSNASDIVRIERLVIAANLEIETELEGLIRDAGKPRTYTTDFPTNKFSVENYEYWVLVINRGYNSATVSINGNRVVSPDDINQHITEIKKLIDPSFLRNETEYQLNGVMVRTTSTPGATMDVYIISAPKETPPDQINLENTAPRKCRVLFYVWKR